MPSLSDVFTLDEIARAAGVPLEFMQSMIDSGELRPLAGTALFSAPDAIRAGRQARIAASHSPLQPSTLALQVASTVEKEQRLSVMASSAVHAIVLGGLIWSATGIAQTAAASDPPRERLVFLMGPGPGGGGGGGGRAPRVAVPRIARPRPVLSETITPDPPPLPSRMLVSPVARSAGDAKPEAPVPDGTGPGTGPGLGEGTGGGTGGGPYRPGSGVDPPRLLKEVKAQYSEEARSRGVRGTVLLEIVIKSDGAVGDVTVIRGLGYGLDERAVTAVRSWRFSPAHMRGEPVDVIVEVEVAFSLR